MALQIEEARTEAERLAIYQLRYRVYVEELQLAPEFADHDRKLLVEPLDAYAHNFYAADDGAISGALRLLMRREGALDHEDLFDLELFRPFYPDAVSMTTKLVVVPSRRASSVLKLLVQAVYGYALKAGIAFDFLVCLPHLINLYEHLGYRRYKSNVNHPEFGYVTPMAVVLEDIEHLQRVGSPLADVAGALPRAAASRSAEAAEFFARRFPEFARVGPRRLLSPEQLWDLLSEKASGRLGEAVPLFLGMTREEIEAVLAAGNLVSCRKGDRIITHGEARQEFYTLLSGRAEVSIEVQGRRRILHLLTTGETFGEMASLADCSRTADVFALEDCEVMVHDADRLARLGQRDPGLAAKFYRNLARVMAFRLMQSNLAQRGLS